MKLTELNRSPAIAAKKALEEHFDTKFNVEKLGLYETKTMHSKVKKLIEESKVDSSSTEQKPAYLKLVFMEQALTHHYGELKTLPMYNQRIVVENEEVEKSQVVLAAQEMIDEMQKMIENISDMLVKELPAVVDGINSEIGTNEGEQFNAQATEALSSLQATLTQSKTGLQSALGVITGQGGSFGDAAGMDAGADMGGDLGGDMGADMGAEDEMGDEEFTKGNEKKIAEKYKLSRLLSRGIADKLSGNYKEKALEQQIKLDTERLVDRFLKQDKQNLFLYLIDYKFPKAIGDVGLEDRLSLFVEIAMEYQTQMDFKYRLEYYKYTDSEQKQKTIGYTLIVPPNLKKQKKTTLIKTA